MDIKRLSIDLEHAVRFATPAASFASQAARLAELLVDTVALDYGLTSDGVSFRSGPALADWAMRLSMFGGQGKIKITTSGLTGSFNRLILDKDLEVVAALQGKVLASMASHSPKLAYAAESVSGSIQYECIGGEEARTAYLAQIAFPGSRDGGFFDTGFKLRRVGGYSGREITLSLDVSPLWSDAKVLFVYFQADTTHLAAHSMGERAASVNEAVIQTLALVGLRPLIEASANG